MIPDRAPTTAWTLRSDFGSWVRTAEDEKIVVYVDHDYIYMSRRDARLVAKRINQCLDATVKQ